MKQGSKSAFVLIFSLACTFSVFAQGISSTFRLAEKLKNDHQYEEALFHYQRVLFFSEGAYRKESHIDIAECYANLGNIQKSLQHYDRAFQYAENDSFANEIMFKKAAANLLNGRYNYALIDLYNIFPTNEAMRARLNFYTGIAFFGKEEFDSARVHFLQVVPHHTSARQKIDSLFDLNKKYHRLNPKAARIMSMIIPGSGQLYAGDVKEALNSMFITFGFGYLMLNTSIQISVVDGFLSVFPWFFRYYMGGYNNAEKIARRRIKEREVKIYNGILRVIENATGHSH